MADRYWVGGTATWDGTAGSKWSTTSGGAGGAAVPTSVDDVFFNSSSGSGTVTIASTISFKTINFTGFTGTVQFNSGANVLAAGDITLGSSTTYSGTGNVSTRFDAACSFRSNGKIWSGGYTFLAAGGGSLTLLDDFTTTAIQPTATNCAVDLNGFTLTCSSFVCSGNNPRTVTFNGGVLAVSSQFVLTGTNLTLNDSDGEYRATSNSITINTNQNINGSIVIVNRCNVSFTNNAILNGELRFETPGTRMFLSVTGVTVGLTLGPDFIFTNTVIDGLWSFVGPSTINGLSQVNIIQTSGTRILDNLAFQDINLTGGATFIGENCIDLGNVTGIDIQQPTNVPVVPRGEDYFLYAETTGPTADNPFGTSSED